MGEWGTTGLAKEKVMFLRYTFPGHWRATFTLAKITTVTGVNSDVGFGNHILLWDFDNLSLDAVLRSLAAVQKAHPLPGIHIYRTRSDADNYHAVCLAVRPWREVVAIIAATPMVDWNFLKWGIHRGHFTLRIGPKEGEIPFPVTFITGELEEDIDWKGLTSFTNYETVLNKGRHHG